MNNFDAGACIVASVLTGLLAMFLFLDAVGNTYKKGQIDYANGIIKYELVTQGDKTAKWQTKKGK